MVTVAANLGVSEKITLTDAVRQVGQGDTLLPVRLFALNNAVRIADKGSSTATAGGGKGGRFGINTVRISVF